MKYIDNISLINFVVFAGFLGLAPFVPEPHLVEKLRMLSEGTLSKPIDIFDLLMHATPWILLGIKLYRVYVLKKTGVEE